MDLAAPMAKFQQNLDKYTSTLEAALRDKSKPWAQAFEIVEAKTNIPRIYIFGGAALFCGLYLIFGFGAQLLCNIIGVVYPAYVSIHAIESSPKNDDTRWLTYWVTYGIMSIIEYFSVVLTSIIPFYWLLKCIFLIWCMLPIQNNGSDVIYKRVVRPYFLKHHKAVDEVIDQALHKVDKVMKGD